MAQVFVPSVGLNVNSQAMAQQGAQVNSNIEHQVNPQQSLNYFYKISDTAQKGLNQWDQMRMQAEALQTRDDLQKQLAANRADLMTKKGKEALDFKPEYEKRNNEIIKNALNNVKDFRIRDALKMTADHLYSNYQISSDGYFKQETARLSLNQAIASAADAAGNYVDNLANGTPQQQEESKQQFEDANKFAYYKQGGDPDAVDGKVYLQKSYDEIGTALNDHYITHKTFNAARTSAEYFKKKMTPAAWLKMSDKIYSAEQVEAATSASAANGYKLPDRNAWVKTHAEDLYQQAIASGQWTEEQLKNPQLQETIRARATYDANLAFDDLTKKVGALQSTENAAQSVAASAIQYARTTGKLFGTDEQIAPEILEDPARILELLPKEMQQAMMQKYGTYAKAQEAAQAFAAPTDATLGGFDFIRQSQSDPNFYSQFGTEKDLRSALWSHGVGAKDAQPILDTFRNQQKQELVTRSNDVIISALSSIDSALVDTKKLKADVGLRQLERQYRQLGNKVIQQTLRINPNATDQDLQLAVTKAFAADEGIKQYQAQQEQLENRLDAMKENDNRLASYSKQTLDAVRLFSPTEFNQALSGDYVTGTERLLNLARKAVKNKQFQNAHKDLPEVQEQLAYERNIEAHRNEQNPFTELMESTLNGDDEALRTWGKAVDNTPNLGISGGKK